MNEGDLTISYYKDGKTRSVIIPEKIFDKVFIMPENMFLRAYYILKNKEDAVIRDVQAEIWELAK